MKYMKKTIPALAVFACAISAMAQDVGNQLDDANSAYHEHEPVVNNPTNFHVAAGLALGINGYDEALGNDFAMTYGFALNMGYDCLHSRTGFLEIAADAGQRYGSLDSASSVDVTVTDLCIAPSYHFYFDGEQVGAYSGTFFVGPRFNFGAVDFESAGVTSSYDVKGFGGQFGGLVNFTRSMAMRLQVAYENQSFSGYGVDFDGSAFVYSLSFQVCF